MNTDDMLAFDKEHILHPYTSPVSPLSTIPVVRAEGVRLILANGQKLIDGMSSWWCAIHGYNHPVLNNALNQQIKQMSHVMFGGITHPPAIDLAKKLLEITHSSLNKVFFCDSGSVSVEVAIKMAIQFWASQGQCNKNRLLTIKNGYHGDTFGAMSVCDPQTGMHHIFSDMVVQQFFAEAPQCRNDADWDGSDIEGLNQILEENHQSIAAVILEPVVQGAGGMRFYAPEYLRQARRLCDQFDVLLIFDEIATGFGRTGKLFAYEHAGVAPDILCLGKAITGGYMSFAATLNTQRVADVIGKNNGVFMHGPTFMANPLACSVAKASIELLMSYELETMISELEKRILSGLEPCTRFSSVKDVRVFGAIGVVEMKDLVDVEKIQKEFVQRGVWVRPFGRLVYIMPPFVIDNNDLDYLTNIIVSVLHQV